MLRVDAPGDSVESGMDSFLHKFPPAPDKSRTSRYRTDQTCRTTCAGRVSSRLPIPPREVARYTLYVFILQRKNWWYTGLSVSEVCA